LNHDRGCVATQDWRCRITPANIPASYGERMLEGLTKRDVVIALLAILAATVLTIEGAYYGLHRFVLDNPNDPLTKQGGLNPSQRVK
jgi:hypothetical protein